MTLPVNVAKLRLAYPGNITPIGLTGGAGALYFLAGSDLVVKLEAPAGTVTPLVYGADYTITGDGMAGAGSYVPLVARAAGTLTIRRATPVIQQTTFGDGDGNPSARFESLADYGRLIDQERQEFEARAAAAPDTDAPQDMTLQPLAVRRGKLAQFEAITGALTAADTSIAELEALLAAAEGAAQTVGAPLWTMPADDVGTALPGSPTMGYRFLLLPGITASPNQVAQWNGLIWTYSGPPKNGQGIFVISKSQRYFFVAGQWIAQDHFVTPRDFGAVPYHFELDPVNNAVALQAWLKAGEAFGVKLLFDDLYGTGAPLTAGDPATVATRDASNAAPGAGVIVGVGRGSCGLVALSGGSFGAGNFVLSRQNRQGQMLRDFSIWTMGIADSALDFSWVGTSSGGAAPANGNVIENIAVFGDERLGAVHLVMGFQLDQCFDSTIKGLWGRGALSTGYMLSLVGTGGDWNIEDCKFYGGGARVSAQSGTIKGCFQADGWEITGAADNNITWIGGQTFPNASSHLCFKSTATGSPATLGLTFIGHSAPAGAGNKSFGGKFGIGARIFGGTWNGDALFGPITGTGGYQNIFEVERAVCNAPAGGTVATRMHDCYVGDLGAWQEHWSNTDEILFRGSAGTTGFAGRAATGHLEPLSDNTQNLGSASLRMAVIYAGTGTINTSDATEKEQIEDIPDAWLDAWGDVRRKRFKFKAAVAAKGAAARFHIGMIAQDVHAAFAACGIDAFQIGLVGKDAIDGFAADEETGQAEVAAREIWNLRPDECAFMEAAWVRRALARLAPG